MADIAFTVAQASIANTLSNGRFTVKQALLPDDADATEWQKVFSEFSVFVRGATTYTITTQIAFKADKSDAIDLDTQDESLRGASYEFVGYAWVRVIRTAAAGTEPTVTLSYRED